MHSARSLALEFSYLVNTSSAVWCRSVCALRDESFLSVQKNSDKCIFLVKSECVYKELKPLSKCEKPKIHFGATFNFYQTGYIVLQYFTPCSGHSGHSLQPMFSFTLWVHYSFKALFNQSVLVDFDD